MQADSRKRNSLYITYDGLLDPLGGSQIIPYLKAISMMSHSLFVLSFEKPGRTPKEYEDLAVVLLIQGIKWKPLSFTAQFGVLGKVWDLVKLYFWGTYLAITNNIKIIHVRGHPAAHLGLFVKRILGAKFLFDFRGLWVDERVDKGSWNLSIWFHRLQYHHFKRSERKLLLMADQVVVLTNAVVDEVSKLGAQPASKITVIPCCADFDHFPLASLQRRVQARSLLGIPHDAMVLGYLGSVGKMYMLDSFFRLFELAVNKRKNVRALIITQDVIALKAVMDSSIPKDMHALVHIKSATREEVAHTIVAFDVLVSFIKPTYARIAASPTKIAECFAVGIPVICNSGVGDVNEQMKSLAAGIIVNPDSNNELSEAVDRLDEICEMGGERLRNEARALLGLEVASVRYKSVYTKLN